MSFLPTFVDNPLGWGPVGEPDNVFKDIPYTPFSKQDKLGKVADWTATSRQNYQNNFPPKGGRAPPPVTPVLNVHEVDEDEGFNLVDSRPTSSQKTKYYKQQYTNYNARTAPASWQNKGAQPKSRTKGQRAPPKQRGWKKQWQNNWRTDQNAKRKYEPSIEVKEEWGPPVAEIPFDELLNHRFEPTVPPVDVVWAGSLESLNQTYTKINCKTPKVLERNWSTERTFFKVTTSDDPIIKACAQSDMAQVYATDAIITHMMAIPKSVYPWDIIIRKKGNQLWLDKRDISSFDYLTVDENSNEPPHPDGESINTPTALSQEATFINQNFTQQILLKDPQKSFRLKKTNPFVTNKNEKVPSVAYRYRKWKLGNLDLLCRSEVDGVLKDASGKPLFMVIKALNEYDPKVTGDWRVQLDSHRASVLAYEMKNNSCKFVKWITQAILADADVFTLGYVSRQKPKDNVSHMILGVHSYKTKEFPGMQIHPSLLWGSVKFLIDQFYKLSDGKYVLMKDPDKPLMRLYKTPE